MGQKVHPNGIRLGIVKKHSSIWYAERGEYADFLAKRHPNSRMVDERISSRVSF